MSYICHLSPAGSHREEAGSIDLWLWAFICPLITLESQNSNVSLISVSLWKLNLERPHSKIGVGPGFEFGSIDYEIEANSAALGPLSACGLSNRISSILPSFPIWEPRVCTHLVSEGLGLSTREQSVGGTHLCFWNGLFCCSAPQPENWIFSSGACKSWVGLRR